MATYAVTSYGHSVIETLGDGKTASMTSVYHLDGDDLRMTHFCGAGNQPRLKATSIDARSGDATYDFVDATTHSAPDAPHVIGFAIHFVDDSHIVIRFRFIAPNGESLETIDLRRDHD